MNELIGSWPRGGWFGYVELGSLAGTADARSGGFDRCTQMILWGGGQTTALSASRIPGITFCWLKLQVWDLMIWKESASAAESGLKFW